MESTRCAIRHNIGYMVVVDWQWESSPIRARKTLESNLGAIPIVRLSEAARARGEEIEREVREEMVEELRELREQSQPTISISRLDGFFVNILRTNRVEPRLF